MKKQIIFCLLATMGILQTACTKLEVPVENELSPGNFPVNQDQLILASGAVYSKFRGSYATSYWQMQSLSTDEAIIVARAGGWYDGGRYQQMHLHTWASDNAQTADTWRWGFGTISTCNQVLALFDQSPASDAKAAIAAEVKTMRAMTYFLMMDLYGNIPLNTQFGSSDLPDQKSRAEVFKFIEDEVKAALPLLSEKVDNSTYGRPTKFAAYALLAKMYLNAQVYVGQDRYNDAIEMCDNIIKSGKYSLDPSYQAMFAANNGPAMKEFIFAIPYDWAQATGQQFTWMDLHYALQQKYGLSFRISGPMSTLPEYYALFNEPNDVRTQIWLTGKQFDNAGNPVIIKTTKKGLDASYSGADGTAPVDYQLTFTPNVTLINPSLFEAGGDELGRAKGYRNNKFTPDASASGRDGSNDVPVFRYADILLMKAEAILRGGNPTLGHTALSLVSSIRDIRKASPITSINLDDLLNERVREMNWEAWRRNDLIRFGKFENSWGYKTDADVNKRIFPIPSSEMILNKKLKQNNGY